MTTVVERTFHVNNEEERSVIHLSEKFLWSVHENTRLMVLIVLELGGRELTYVGSSTG